jgi:hypothetical protein
MRILIYEPLPDINRAPVIAAVAKGLRKAGHDVLLVLEEQLLHTLHNNDTVTHIDCRRTMRASLPPAKGIDTFLLRAPVALYSQTEDNKTVKHALNQISRLRIEQYSSLITKFQPEHCFIWNGKSPHLADFMKIAHQQGLERFYYMECGWFPQKGTIYFDPIGVNAASSIASKKFTVLSHEQERQLENWKREYFNKQSQSHTVKRQIFVPLQVDTDTNITLYSPFNSMKQFIEFLEEWIPADYKVILRPHPLGNYTYPIESHKPNFKVDSASPINKLIDSSELTLGINSTVLLEALLREKPVLALGSGILGEAPILDGRFEDRPQQSYLGEKSKLYDLIFHKQQLIKDLPKLLELPLIPRTATSLDKTSSVGIVADIPFSHLRMRLNRMLITFRQWMG